MPDPFDVSLTPDELGLTNMADYDPSKLRALLRSRKFWTTATATALTAYLYLTGDLSPDAFADAVSIIAAVYVGSVALEDGLRGLVNIWTASPPDNTTTHEGTES